MPSFKEARGRATEYAMRVPAKRLRLPRVAGEASAVTSDSSPAALPRRRRVRGCLCFPASETGTAVAPCSVGLKQVALLRRPGGTGMVPCPTPEHHGERLLTCIEAERLLDWLEANHLPRPGLVLAANGKGAPWCLRSMPTATSRTHPGPRVTSRSSSHSVRLASIG
jgi:hypothetical protein